VYVASSPEVEVAAVAKLVPKAPGAQRELLFVDLEGARNVMPVLDSGETDSDYVLVMPRADKSLRSHLGALGELNDADAVSVLRDITAALEDLDGRVVHRDLKPENVLYLNGFWCLADFGISRYAEATTAEDTRKYSMTGPYAAPEQWRFERARGLPSLGRCTQCSARARNCRHGRVRTRHHGLRDAGRRATLRRARLPRPSPP